ncbi:MAG: ubiquinone/menaquinone biosynthesis methyltransferase [Fimbriimonadaceae bacterium]
MTPTKPIWLADGREKRERVQTLFADLAPVYDRANRMISFAGDRRWRRAAVRALALRQGDTVADLCCGTGDFMLPIRAAVGDTGLVVGLDFCLPMLEHAKAKAVPGELAASDACALPLARECVDAVTIGWGLRNVADLHVALQEAFRILKPGGRIANLDMAQPKSAPIAAVSRVAFAPLLKTAGARVGKAEAYAYLAESTIRFASRDTLAAAMVAVGFAGVRYRDFALGHVCLHVATKPS